MSTSRPRNAAFAGLAPYAFVRLDEAKARARARGITVIDFTIGDPREETPRFVRERLIEAIPERSSYPSTIGTPALRQAIVDWVGRRFGVVLDPDREIVPANGSKEAVYSIHQVVVDPASDRRIVWIPDPAYPVYDIAARFAGAEVRALPLEPPSFLPDLTRIDPALWSRTALLWLNYPNNPTGASASRGFYAEALDLARRHGFWLASDEAYSEIYFGDPPPSALQEGLENLLVFQTLSKRSAMTGYRSGFMAGDRELIEMLRRVRPSQGVATPTFIQEAATAAWCEESHVAVLRDIYRRKRVLLRGVLERAGLEIARSDATFFLYFRAPAGETSASFAERMLEHGIAMAPGEMFGATGEGWVRMALVPTEEECAHAAALLERHLGDR
ncbi:MAG: aminotransferase class I/II-fold pyridoxal phosphate-dependent enzyme [Candidatus Eisenbacteria bacterium]|uniref:Aminotransferase class I/II-fold pyridoxal phosphate-dependent enzyme n=1 Tax=Eiseniibacteriota bacterium TaxID=2212470 RepID=A0A956M3J6_UNCEI|nr:aminotransferase class I/II-fold pyridoxal phosphate-dependent enzyme [Candidatus Eisenbacteria bacterium]